MKIKEVLDYEKTTDGLDRYDPELNDNQNGCTITKIVVPTERDKEQLLKAFEYIHNLRDIDSDFLAVNTIMHLYLRPDIIEVENNNG